MRARVSVRPDSRSSSDERRRAEGHREDKEDDEDSQEEADRFELVASAHPPRDRGASTVGFDRPWSSGVTSASSALAS